MPERAVRRSTEETIDRAIALSPVRPAARIVRARLRALDGDLPGAYADAAQAARLYPIHADYVDARDALAEALDGSDRRREERGP